MNELTRWTSAVRSQAAGWSLANLRICGPVKRSMAREPVRATMRSSPPTAAAISAHSAPVELSIQIGAVGRLRSGATWSRRGVLGDQSAASSRLRAR